MKKNIFVAFTAVISFSALAIEPCPNRDFSVVTNPMFFENKNNSTALTQNLGTIDVQGTGKPVEVGNIIANITFTAPNYNCAYQINNGQNQTEILKNGKVSCKFANAVVKKCDLIPLGVYSLGAPYLSNDNSLISTNYFFEVREKEYGKWTVKVVRIPHPETFKNGTLRISPYVMFKSRNDIQINGKNHTFSRLIDYTSVDISIPKAGTGQLSSTGSTNGSTNTGGTGGESNTNTSSDFSNNGSSLFGGPSSKGATPYPSDNKTEKAGIMDLSPISLDWVDKHKNHLIRIKIPVMVIDATEGDIKKLTNTYPEISFGAAPENVATLKSIFTYYGIETYPAMLNDGWVFPE